MRSGYRVLWTDHALEELDNAVEYLQLNFTDVEIVHDLFANIVIKYSRDDSQHIYI